MNRISRTALAVTLLVSSRAGAQVADPPALDPAPPAATSPAAAPAAGPAAAAPAQPAPVKQSPAAAQVTSAKGGPVFWGFVNLQFARTDPPGTAAETSTFQARRARVGARGDVTPNLGYAFLFDAADVSLKDAYGAVKGFAVPGLEIRGGQWKTPFGYEQPESDTKLLWVNSSYVVQALARSNSTTSVNATPDSRDLGLGIVGRWGARSIVGAELAASVVNGAGPNRTDDLQTKNFWGRAGLTGKVGVASLRAGGSYGAGQQVAGLGADGRFDGVGTPKDDTYFWFSTYGADVEVDSPWLFAAAEWIQSERDQRTFASPSSVTATGFTARGWYAGVYGKSPWNVGPIFRAEWYDRSSRAKNDHNERYTVGAYVDVLPVNARLVFNYEIDQSAKAVRTGDRAILFGQVIF